MLKHGIINYFLQLMKSLITHRLGNVSLFLTWIVKFLCEIGNSYM